MFKKITNYFTKGEILLWTASVVFIIMSFLIFDRENYLTLLASLIGVTSLIYNSKGNPTGPFLMIAFSLLYGFISFKFTYYGEMLTYVGMTAPMSFFALIAWLKNPNNGNKSEVKIASLKIRDIVFIIPVTIIVTLIFYFILKAFHTANLLPSTISVTTSFLAVYLTYKRSSFFALAYAANDVVLIILWILASLSDISYLSVMVCFVVFLINDIYTFINWTKIQKRQRLN